MANNERIDDIISDEAFAQLDLLLKKLGEAQNSFGELAKSVTATNTEINKSQSIKEFNDAIKEANKNFTQLEEQQKKVTKAREEANKAEKQLVETTKAKLTVDEGAKKILQEYSGTVEQLIKVQVQIKATVKELTAEQKSLDGAYQQGLVSAEAYAKRSDEIAVALAEGRQAVTDFNLEIRRSLKENNAVEGSYDAVSARLDRLRGLYRRLSEEERNNIEVGGALLQSIQQTDEELKNIDKSLGITNRNVGNYREAIEEALDQTGLFGREIGFLKQAKQSYDAVSKVATISTQGFGKALIATGIGAILILIGALVAFLTKTQAGMDLVAKATAGVTTFLTVFLDALSTLGEQIVNSFLPILTGLKDAFVGLVTLDFDQLKKGLDGVKNGLDGIDPINLVEVAKEAGRASVEAVKLADQLKKLSREERALEIERSRSRANLEALKLIAEDQTKSTKEREEATKQALNGEQELLNKSIALKERELAIVKAQNALTKSTDADKDKEIDLEIELNNLKEESTTKQIELNNKLNELRRNAQTEELARQKEREAQAKKVSEAVFKLEDSRLARTQERAREVIEDEKLAFEDRTANLETYLKTAEERILLARDKELSNADLLKEDRLRIEEQAQAEIEAVKKQGAVMAEKILLDQLGKEERALVEANKAIIDKIKQGEAEKLTALNEELNSGLIGEKEYQNKRLQIIQEAGRAVLLEEIKQAQAVIDANKAKGLNVAEEERRLAELKQQLSEETTQKTLEDLDKIAQREEEIKALREQLANEVANLVTALVQRRFVKQEEELAKQEEQIEIQKQREIDAVNASVLTEEEKQLRILNAEKKAELQRAEIERRRRKIELQKARFEKAKAILGIKVDTARAIVAQLPFLPASAPLIALISAIGLAQLGTALAQPIPQFAKGTKYSPEGLAIVGEEGMEMIKDPQGNVSFTGDSAELTYLKRGSEVVPHKEVVKMMQNDSGVWEAMIAEQRRGTSELKKALSKRPEKVLNVTKGGLFYLYKHGGKVDKYVNKLL